jgi:hypothetical protein
MSCLAVNVVGDALALVLALALAEFELELELELELEHPAVAARPAATTVVPSRVAVRRLRFFTKLVVCDPSDARGTGIKRAGERRMTRRGPRAGAGWTAGSPSAHHDRHGHGEGQGNGKGNGNGGY